MQFIKTLLPLFFVWQVFSMSPFALTRVSLRPKINQIHNVLAIFSISIQIIVFIHGNISYDYFIDPSNKLVYIILDLVTMIMVRVLAIIIVFESRVKRSAQIKFLKKIDEVDRVLNKRLRIDLEYKKQCRKSLALSFAGICFYVILELILLMRLEISDERGPFIIFWFFYAVPQLICSMRYHQTILYIYLVDHRYRLINAFIKNINYSPPSDIPIANNIPPVEIFSREIFRPNQVRNLKKLIIIDELKQLRYAQRFLFQATKLIRDQFYWSSLFNIANDFQLALTSLYYIIWTFWTGGPISFIAPIIVWAAYNIVHIVSFTIACESVVQEV